MLERADQGLLKWFGHRTGEERLIKSIYSPEGENVRLRGRLGKGWRECKATFHHRRLTIHESESHVFVLSVGIMFFLRG